MLVSVVRIPARTGFHLSSPMCDTRLTAENVGLSLTKVPHMVLFGIFYLLTVLQFDVFGRRTILVSLAATAGLGLLVELEEGATRTGNCRITDVVPDLVGALIVAGLLIVCARITRAAD